MSFKKAEYSIDEIVEYVRSKALQCETTHCYITKETNSTIFLTFKQRKKNTILRWIKPKFTPHITEEDKKKLVAAYA